MNVEARKTRQGFSGRESTFFKKNRGDFQKILGFFSRKISRAFRALPRYPLQYLKNTEAALYMDLKLKVALLVSRLIFNTPEEILVVYQISGWFVAVDSREVLLGRADGNIFVTLKHQFVWVGWFGFAFALFFLDLVSIPVYSYPRFLFNLASDVCWYPMFPGY